jgi:hypothetical protein
MRNAREHEPHLVAPAWCRCGGGGRNSMEASKMKIVYVISDRNNRKFWNRIGVAFVNSDGSVNVKLEAIPVSGEMQIRDYIPREDMANGQTSRATGTDQLVPLA